MKFFIDHQKRKMQYEIFDLNRTENKPSKFICFDFE